MHNVILLEVPTARAYIQCHSTMAARDVVCITTRVCSRSPKVLRDPSHFATRTPLHELPLEAHSLVVVLGV